GHRPHVSRSALQGYSRAGTEHRVASTDRGDDGATARAAARSRAGPNSLAIRGAGARDVAGGNLFAHQDRSMVHTASRRDARDRLARESQRTAQDFRGIDARIEALGRQRRGNREAMERKVSIGTETAA